MLATKGIAKAASPVPEREVSSHPPVFPAGAGGKRENWKALQHTFFPIATTLPKCYNKLVPFNGKLYL